MSATVTAHDKATKTRPLNHLWLEITGKCNLHCGHCYADSGPDQPLHGKLSTEDWLDLIREARSVGCESLQFIGGEPSLHPGLAAMLELARSLNFERIEVFTNATLFTADRVAMFRLLGVSVATSFYSADAARHDAITETAGSFEKTIAGIRRAVADGLELRVGIVQITQTDEEVKQAKEFLSSLGVQNIEVDRVRAIGRGAASVATEVDFSQLCGGCSDYSLCVTPTGSVHPCIMARAANLGSARDGLQTILAGRLLREFVDAQAAYYASGEAVEAACAESGPVSSCNPYCNPKCNPFKGCSPKCIPW